MPKPRAPIATRLRNKTKNNQQPSLSQNEGEINQESCSQNTANDRQTSSPPQDKGSETFPPHKPKYCQDSFPQSKHSRTSSSTRSSSEGKTLF
jgi:hypothetical protein